MQTYIQLKSSYDYSVETSGFFIAQILREINFGDSRTAKNAILGHFRICEFVDLVYFRLQIVQKFMKKSNFRASKCVKMADFALLESPKLISRKI